MNQGEVNKVLLIGNASNVMRFPWGERINGFDGIIARFNNCVVAGYERFVGSRTDVWITCGEVPGDRTAELGAGKVLLTVPPGFSNLVTRFWEGVHPNTTKEFLPERILRRTATEMGFHPSSGAVAAAHFIQEGYSVFIHGFNFHNLQEEHHYWKTGQRRGHHRFQFEKEWFEKRIEEGKIFLYHENAFNRKQSVGD